MSLEYLYVGLLRINELGLMEISQENSNYRRIEMGPADWYAKGDCIFNADTILFNIATNNWGLITHFGIFDSLDNGNILTVGNLIQGSIFYVFKNIQIRFKANKLAVEIKALGLEIENG